MIIQQNTLPEQYSIVTPISDELEYYDKTIQLSTQEKVNMIVHLENSRIEYVSWPSDLGVPIENIQLIHSDINNLNSKYMLLSNAVSQLRKYAADNNVLAEEISNTYSFESNYYSTIRG